MKKTSVFFIVLVVLFVVALYGQISKGQKRMEKVTSIAPEEQLPQGALTADVVFDFFEVYKAKRLLVAYSNGKVVRRYIIALGFTPVGHKEYEGDGKTPEGKYTIDQKNPHSQYYKNVNISYPNEVDRKHAEQLGKSPGGDIKIHGLAQKAAWLGKNHILSDWTAGCIAVTNEEMEEIYTHVKLGAEIHIFE